MQKDTHHQIIHEGFNIKDTCHWTAVKRYSSQDSHFERRKINHKMGGSLSAETPKKNGRVIK